MRRLLSFLLSVRRVRINKLKLNKNNPKLMEINMHTNSSFRINNVVIEKANNIMYPGFY